MQRGRTSGSVGNVFVALTLEEGRHMPWEGHTGGHAPQQSGLSEVTTEVPFGSWALMDQVDLEEEFLRRTPMLKSCPHFLRGRLRRSQLITLQERCRAKLVGDTLGEEARGEWLELMTDSQTPNQAPAKEHSQDEERGRRGQAAVTG